MFGSLFTKSSPGLFPSTHLLQNGDAAWALHDNRWYRVRVTAAFPPTKRGETTTYTVWHWNLFNKDFGSLTTESGALALDDANTRLWLRECVGKDGVVKTDWPAMGH
ncbi:unnamed protein product [Peniophora sp. CBMAI 1063]|nr:unnamed protein product [Peniophora sp. CBMAI 1063]